MKYMTTEENENRAETVGKSSGAIVFKDKSLTCHERQRVALLVRQIDNHAKIRDAMAE